MYGSMPSEKIYEIAGKYNAKVVDLRSDTLTKPTPAMLRAMSEAVVGDDVYGEDPTVKELERQVALLTGMEAGLFVPSGTMSNLVAVMTHCDTRGCEIYVGEHSHIAQHEQGGAAQVAGVTVNALPQLPDGSFDLGELGSRLKSDWLHEPFSRLVAIENTINGKAVPRAWIADVARLARERNLRVHCDGARIVNASVATGTKVADILEGCDSVSVCLSKGLAAPVGSVLCGSAPFIRRARRTRKVLGGGMRQSGVLAAAGLVALKDAQEILLADHKNCRMVAEALARYQSEDFSVDLATTHTNMMFVKVRQTEAWDAYKFVARMQQVRDEEDPRDLTLVRGLALSPNLARFVFHRDIDEDMAKAVKDKIDCVLRSA
ncbi:hypothetical protein TKK_0000534 [Trichogramma kaykai]|uniref:Aromatic amino acid beta-eliminating lyase/threonine aldolase domain-containing protein n=1 Tax=Trichogramma kaykai TaxID=54128 RepID=A0ABD2WKK4_9HYME